MNITDSVTAFSALVSLFGIWAVVCLYLEYRVDCFRQDIFELRGELFEAAASGLIAFDHPGYGLLRSTLNGFIRFGHRLGLMEVLLSFWLVRGAAAAAVSFEREWQACTKNLPGDVRQSLTALRKKMNLLVLKHLLTSPAFALAAAPLALIILAKRLRRQVDGWNFAPFSKLDSTALAYGRQ